MGEVYKAHDGRLDRLVAIKVLLPSANPAERLARFEREARAISALEHPNICAVYDVGETDGTHFIVFQYLEGQTLAERLKRGPLPVSQVIRHGVEIADALDRAHRVGIVHRDLKPSNVMLTKSGAKLLDFGLARLQDEPAPIGMSSLTRLGAHELTAEGTLLGTYHYMAPEQVEGRRADHRADIFAFGAVLYEAATGSRAFSGPTSASVIGAILKDDPPPITTQSPLAPQGLVQLVRTCLEKDPDDRWQSTADLKRQLEWIGSSRGSSDSAAPVRPPSKWAPARRWMGLTAVAGALALVVPAAWRPDPEAPAVEFEVYSPSTSTFAAPIGQVPSTQMAVAPDGSALVFVATAPGERSRLWMRALADSQPVALPGTDGASFPFWSPNSQHVAFFSKNRLMRIGRDGASAREICTVGADPRGGAWNPDNVIIFAPDPSSGLSRVSADAGSPETLLDLAAGHSSYRWPAFLPDGRRFLFHVKEGSRKSIHLGSLDGVKPEMVLDNAPYAAAFSPSGYLLTVRARTLLAYPFDANSLPITADGIPVRGADNVGGSTSLRASFSVSATGVLAYAGPLLTPSRLEWFDQRGNSQGFATDTRADYVGFRISPGGERVAVTMVDEQNDTTDLWLLDVRTRLLERFTNHRDTDTSPVWSSDGKRVRFRSDRAGGLFPFEKPADKSAQESRVAAVETVFLTDWSSDGQFIAFHSFRKDTGTYNVGVVALETGAAPQFIDASSSTQLGGRFSPEGKWVAYSSDDSGQMEVYVGRYPSGPGKLVSNGGGSEPHWRADGRELFYLGANRSLMSVAVGPGAEWSAGPSRELFQTGVLFPGDIYRMNYDEDAQGQRFLIARPVEAVRASPITVVLYWAARLKR